MTRVDDTPVHRALREALANALIHANYYDRRGLVIHRRPQKITIANPGGFRISVHDALVGGLSDPRNITLVKMFNLLSIGERAGSGIPNIYSVWRTQGWRDPVLDEQFNPDRTVLTLTLSPIGDRKTGSAIEVGDREAESAIESVDAKQKIIEYLTDNVTCKASDISELLNLKPSRTRDYLAQLVAEDILIAEGVNRYRTYRLKS
ncbi:MAG: hypothetical protein LBH86_06965 [Oscillospiraceae bacterium]|jgi:predicted HTH transcriptional regulator|nr:hypothetical protein [Oscillospiraceae bacterium]